jgi:hypothetical protein
MLNKDKKFREEINDLDWNGRFIKKIINKALDEAEKQRQINLDDFYESWIRDGDGFILVDRLLEGTMEELGQVSKEQSKILKICQNISLEYCEDLFKWLKREVGVKDAN